MYISTHLVLYISLNNIKIRYRNKKMKKISILIVGILFLSACSSQSSEGDAEVTPTPDEIVIDLDQPTPTPDEIIIDIDGDDDVIIVNPTSVPNELRPSTLPVLFEYQATGFDLEFFWDGSKYLYWGTIRVPNVCYNAEKIVSVLRDSTPDKVSMIFRTTNPGEDCTQPGNILEVSGEVPVAINSRYTVIIDDVYAVKVFPSPTPTPIITNN